MMNTMYRGTITTTTKKFYADLTAFMAKHPDLELLEEVKSGLLDTTDMSAQQLQFWLPSIPLTDWDISIIILINTKV